MSDLPRRPAAYPASRELPAGFPAHLDPEVFLRFRLVLDGEGRFVYQGGFVENPRVAALFHRSLHRRADGSYRLLVGRQEAPVEVAEAPRFVEHFEAVPNSEDELRVTLLGGMHDTADLRTLGPDEDGRMRVTLRSGDEALFTRKAAHALAEALVEDPASPTGAALVLGRHTMPLHPHPRRTLASPPPSA